MQNLLTLCYSFNNDKDSAFKSWVLAEKLMNQLATKKTTIGTRDGDAGVDLSALMDSVDQTAKIRELEKVKETLIE